MAISRHIILALAILMTHSFVNALPRFALRTNLKCQSCHIDPNGGGMRNYYGAALYSKWTLPLQSAAPDSTLDDFTTELSKYVSFGSDLRTLFYYQQKNSASSFYQMQGNIYLSARLASKVLVYFNKGLYHGFEVFGLANLLPANGYIKVGRFTPPYGTRIDDHTVFVRDSTDFQNNRREDTGIEIGISPSIFTWSAGIFNGVRDNDFSSGKIRLFSTRLEAKIKFEDLKLSLGGSAWYNNSQAGTFTMFGGFGGVSYQRLALSAEFDLKKDKAGYGTNELISYLELNYLLIDGLDLKFIHDFHDPDVKYRTGSQSRYSLGLEFFPVNGVEIRPMYRIHKEDPVDVQNNLFDCLVHFYL